MKALFRKDTKTLESVSPSGFNHNGDETYVTDLTAESHKMIMAGISGDQAFIDAGDGVLAVATKGLPVPEKITPRQLHLALLELNTPVTKAMIEGAIGQLPVSQKEVAEIEYSMANEFLRGNQFIAILAQSLGLESDAVDELFRQAEKL